MTDDDVLTPALRQIMTTAADHLSKEMATLALQTMEQYLKKDTPGMTRDHVYTVIYEATAHFLNSITRSACQATDPMTTSALLLACFINITKGWEGSIFADGRGNGH